VPKIGDVSDILFDKDGKIEAYVVSVGGFLGMGSKDVAIAPTSFDVLPGSNGSADKLKLSMSKDQLKEAQNFEPYQPPHGRVPRARRPEVVRWVAARGPEVCRAERADVNSSQSAYATVRLTGRAVERFGVLIFLQRMANDAVPVLACTGVAPAHGIFPAGFFYCHRRCALAKP